MGGKNIKTKYISMLLRSLAKPLYCFRAKAVTYLSAMCFFFCIVSDIIHVYSTKDIFYFKVLTTDY